MNFKCEKVEQITIVLEDRPGVLADLCAHLGAHGIDMKAVTTVDMGHEGSVRIVVDRPSEAVKILESAGVPCTVSDCLAIEMPNHPNGFAGIARVLALAGINIDFFYGSSIDGQATALGVFGVSDVSKAMDLF